MPQAALNELSGILADTLIQMALPLQVIALLVLLPKKLGHQDHCSGGSQLVGELADDAQETKINLSRFVRTELSSWLVGVNP